MKVLKNGTGQRGWSKECVCSGSGNGGGGCGAVLLVEQPDLFQTSSTDYGGSTEYFTTFECCLCGVLTDITVPSSVPVASKRPSERSEGAK